MLERLLPFTRRITERTVLWGLVIGFGLVVVLLGMAGLVAVRDSQAIRQSSSGLVKGQLLIARLLYEVQAEEDALAHVLHLLVKSEDATGRSRVLDDLKEADRDVSRLAIEAAQTPHAGEWRKLAQATQAFSDTAKQALDYEGPLPKSVLESLFASHDEVVKLIHDLILQSTRHLSEVNEEIEAQLKDLADESKILLGACFVFAALCAMLTIRFVRHSIGRIRWQSDELNRVSWHMLQTQEEAARRFSHELHDELGQSLAAVRANLTRGSTNDLESLRNDCLGLVDESIANVRELSQLLRPVILDDFGLEAGLRWLVEKFAQRTRLEVKVDTDCPGRFADETETHLFRIAQEALTNIARHAEATSVTIKLQRGDANIHLSICDNGKGMPPENSEARSSLGMVGMRARARQCGGELSITPAEPHGVCVEVVVPARTNEGNHAMTNPQLICAISGRALREKQAVPCNVLRPSLLQFMRKKHPQLRDGDFIARDLLPGIKAEYVEYALSEEIGEITHLERDVIESLREHEIVSASPSEKDDERTFGERLSDRIAELGGSWAFITGFGLFLMLWVVVNTLVLATYPPDPYPFIFLNLILSCIAALQAPVIMMSQNRQAARDRQQAEQDYKINLKAELEIRHLHEKMDHLLHHHSQRLLEIQHIQTDLLRQLVQKGRDD